MLCWRRPLVGCRRPQGWLMRMKQRAAASQRCCSFAAAVQKFILSVNVIGNLRHHLCACVLHVTNLWPCRFWQDAFASVLSAGLAGMALLAKAQVTLSFRIARWA